MRKSIFIIVAVASILVLNIQASAEMEIQAEMPAETTAEMETANVKSGDIRVKISGFIKTDAEVLVLLFKSPDGFPGESEKAYEIQNVKPNILGVKTVFENKPLGEYAIFVLHDQYPNGKLDRTIFGKPLEGFGASENPDKKRSDWKFEEAKFEHSSDGTEQDIIILYFPKKSI